MYGLQVGDLLVTASGAYGRVRAVIGEGHYSITLFARMQWGFVATAQRRLIAASEIVAFKAGTATSAAETAPAAA